MKRRLQVKKDTSLVADEIPSNRPYWLLVTCVAAATLWTLALLGQPLTDKVYRWTLFLIPDQAVNGWFDGPVTIDGFFDRCRVWLVSGCTIGLAAWAGHLLLRKTTIRGQLRGPEYLALGTALGLGLFSSVILAIGLLGIIRSTYALFVSIGVLIFLAAGIGRIIRKLSVESHASPIHPYEPTAPSNFSATLLPRILSAAFGCLIILRATLPPAEYDVREYHLQAPKEWWLVGSIEFMPHNIYANMPMAAEVNSLFSMMIWNLFGSDATQDAWWWGALSGKVVIASYAIFLSFLIGGCVRIVSGNLRVSTDTAISAGRWMQVVVLSFPAIVEGSSLGLIETPIACFFSAGLLILFCEVPGNQNGTLFNIEMERTSLVALAAGSAVACKYPAVVLIAPILIALWAFGFSMQTSARIPLMVARLRSPKLLLVWLVALALAGGLWYLKNAVIAENPVYPLAAKWLGGKTLTPEKIAQWNAGHATPKFGVGALFESFVVVLWKWRLQGWATIPFAVTGLAFLVVSNRRDLLYTLVLACVYACGIWWIATHRVDRFLIPALPLAFLFAGIGLSAVAHEFGKRWAIGLVAVLIAFNALYDAGPALGDSRMLVSLDYLRKDDLSESTITRLPEHVRWLNKNLSSDSSESHVLSVGDAAVFDFTSRVDYSTTFDRSPLTVLTSLPENQWKEAFRTSTYEYILVHWGEIERLRSTYGFDESINRDLIDALVVQKIIEPVETEASEGRWQLFRVKR